MVIPDDVNAQAAFEATVVQIYCRGDKNRWASLSESQKQDCRNEAKRGRIRQFLEEGKAKMVIESGTFVCTEGYAFKTKVEDVKTHTIYRCDGGHHYGVIFKEFKERQGDRARERKLVLRNGEYVLEDAGQQRNEDHMELDD